MSPEAKHNSSPASPPPRRFTPEVASPRPRRANHGAVSASRHPANAARKGGYCFSLAGASVVGPAHARVGRNNQDAWAAWVGDDLAVLAVADGCSGGVASEVGAQFAARWVVAQAARRWSHGRRGRHEELARELFDGLAQELGALAATLASEPRGIPSVVADLLLATVLVALVDHDVASVFGVGDGLIVVDGAPVVLECDRQRGPEYLAYRLCDRADTGYDPDSIAPRQLAEVQTDAIQTLVLATDGAHELLPARAGRDRFTALFEDGLVARRPALLQARLGEMAAEPGLLDDDVTLVALMVCRNQTIPQFPQAPSAEGKV